MSEIKKAARHLMSRNTKLDYASKKEFDQPKSGKIENQSNLLMSFIL